MALTKVTSHFITGTITNDTSGNAATVTNGIYTNESHSNPSWITGLAWSKITGAPAFITGITSSNVTTALGFTPVTNARQITINGTSFDLSADRSWTITSMIYPSAGIPISTGSGWGSSITNNSSNWNTAYGWGNHASAGYLTSLGANSVDSDNYVDGSIDTAHLADSTSSSTGVTYAKMQKVTNMNRILGRISPTDLTVAQLTKSDVLTMLNVADGANNYSLPFTDNSANWNTAHGWGNHASGGYASGSVFTTFGSYGWQITDYDGVTSDKGRIYYDNGDRAFRFYSEHSGSTGAANIQLYDGSAYSELTKAKIDKLDGIAASANNYTFNGTLSGDLTWGNGYKLSNGNNSNNAEILSAAGGAAGIVIKDSGGTFKMQLYGEGGNYGLLNAEWGGWDLKKANNGELSLWVSSVQQTVIHSGNYGSYAVPLSGGTMSGTLTLTGGNGNAGTGLQLYETGVHQYPQVYSNGNYEAMWNYRNSGSQWYVGIRTSSQLLGTTGFHFYNTTSGQTVGGFDVSGNGYAIGSYRAPIFYDSNNTVYYLDPTSTSNISSINLVSPSTLPNTTRASRVYISNDNQVKIMTLSSAKAQFGLPYNSWSRGVDWGTSDSNYYTGVNSFSNESLNSTVAGRGSGFIDVWSNPVGQPSGTSHWNGHQAFHYVRQSDLGNIYGYQFVVGAGNPANTYIRGIWSGSSWGSWYRVHTDTASTMYAQASFRAPSFVDSDNTGYYLDPSSTSNVYTLQTANYIRLTDSDGYIYGGSISTRSGARAIHMGYAGSCIAQFERTGSSTSAVILSASVNQTNLYSRVTGSSTSGRTFVIQMGNSAAVTVATNKYVTLHGGSSSDIILKKNIEDHSYGIDAVNNLKPRKFDWKDHTLPQEKQVGFIAQELEEVVPEAVYGFDGAKAIMPSAMISVLTKGIQELSQQVTDLKAEVELLKQ